MTLQTEAFDDNEEGLYNNQAAERKETSLPADDTATRHVALMQHSMIDFIDSSAAEKTPVPPNVDEPAKASNSAASGSPTPGHDEMVLDFRYGPSVPEGVYEFSDTDVELRRNRPTRYGIRDQVLVTFQIETPAGTLPLEQRYIASKSDDSLFNRLVMQMLGYRVGNKFDCRALIGVAGKLRVVHKPSQSGDIFANVEEVWDCVRK